MAYIPAPFAINPPIRHRSRCGTFLRMTPPAMPPSEAPPSGAPSTQPIPAPCETVPYFSFGSNMTRDKLRSRLGKNAPPITFARVTQARLPGWALCFDLRGAAPAEPAMASIQPQPGAVVHGLVYDISDTATWRRLLVTEGVTESNTNNSYRVVDLDVEILDPERPGARDLRTVKTLVTNPTEALPRSIQPYVRPSKRYMGLLIDGAEQEGLPAEYVAGLKAVPTARKWSPSPLRFLMTLAIPCLFLARKMKIRRLTTPLWRFGTDLYAAHERLMLEGDLTAQRRVKLALVRTLLFLLYAAYTLPILFLFLINPKCRHFYRMVVALFDAEEKKQCEAMREVRTAGEDLKNSVRLAGLPADKK